MCLFPWGEGKEEGREVLKKWQTENAFRKLIFVKELLWSGKAQAFETSVLNSVLSYKDINTEVD